MKRKLWMCFNLFYFQEREKKRSVTKKKVKGTKKVKTTAHAAFAQVRRRVSSAHNQYSSVLKYRVVGMLHVHKDSN